MEFRDLDKEPAPGQIPIALADTIRERAARERRSLSSVMTELLAFALDYDPGEFGLAPEREPGRTPAHLAKPTTAGQAANLTQSLHFVNVLSVRAAMGGAMSNSLSLLETEELGKYEAVFVNVLSVRASMR